MMPTTRLEAFSDGVLAIIITIMVLELKVPHGEDLSVLAPLLPVFLSYVLSFVYIGIYWNNHHHMLHAVKRISGGVLWANLHLLFWLSLLPFVTGWMGENHFARLPTALYGGVLLMAAIAYQILVVTIIAEEGPDSLLGEGGRQGPQGQSVGRRLCRGDRALLLLQSLVRAGDLRSRRPGLAGARPADRAGPAAARTSGDAAALHAAPARYSWSGSIPDCCIWPPRSVCRWWRSFLAASRA